MNNKLNLELVDNIEDIPNLNSDADGVCLDLSSRFHEFMLSEFGHVAVVNEPENFNFSDAYPDVKDPHKRVVEMFNSRDWFSGIKAYPEAVEAFKSIHSAGKKIRIVTSCGTSKEVRNARLECLEREFPGLIDDVVFEEFGAKKNNVLSKLSRSIFIDDLEVACIDASKSDHIPFLFDRKYNQNDLNLRHFNRIKSWSELPFFKIKSI